ncbi:MAG: 7-carboxy-7-deazaguanine synthase, partial [Candidatus Paceibacteria bacterium]
RSRTPIHEVFSSIQGEGLFVGEPQVFVRLSGCPLRCSWCDTPETWGMPPAAREGADWQAGLTRSWCSTEEVALQVESLDPTGSKAISVTGGEPLMWPEFIAELRTRFPNRRLHLETAGAFPRSLSRVLGSVDHVSADLKLPRDLEAPVELAHSSGRVGQYSFESAPADAEAWAVDRRAVLQLLVGRDACLKLVLAGTRSVADYHVLLADVQELAPELPLFLQPATATRSVPAPEAKLVEEVTLEAEKRGLAVRVLPQLHVLLGMR